MDSFVADCRHHVQLETLREDLHIYFKTLKNAMVELINKDYADFVNLSSNLVSFIKASTCSTHGKKYLADNFLSHYVKVLDLVQNFIYYNILDEGESSNANLEKRKVYLYEFALYLLYKMPVLVILCFHCSYVINVMHNDRGMGSLFL